MDNKKLLQEVIATIESKKQGIQKRMTETEVFVKTEKENIHLLNNIQYSLEQIQKQIDEKENLKTEGTVGLNICCNNCIQRKIAKGVNCWASCAEGENIEGVNLNTYSCMNFKSI